MPNFGLCLTAEFTLECGCVVRISARSLSIEGLSVRRSISAGADALMRFYDRHMYGMSRHRCEPVSEENPNGFLPRGQDGAAMETGPVEA